MMRRTIERLLWQGGLPAILGKDVRQIPGMRINIEEEVVQGSMPQEAIRMSQERDINALMTARHWRLSPVIYSELQKLPLRYALHPFEALKSAQRLSPSIACATGVETEDSRPSASNYGLPLGPADDFDTIPFHIHRDFKGMLPGRIRSVYPKTATPSTYLRIHLIDGDVFRFEDELIKIFPTKKTFVRHHVVFVFSLGNDGLTILHHWMLGLGF